MIPNIREKIKRIPHPVREDIFIAVVILFVGLISFALGRISALEEGKGSFEVLYLENTPTEAIESSGFLEREQKYVASKSGTKYHLLSCAGAQSIKEENKIYFSTKEEAERAGYSPAANCKGI